MSSLLHFLESHSCLSVLLPCVFSCIANLISFAFPCNEFLVCVIPFVLKRVPCMFPHVFLPALHRFATIILFPVCSPVRYIDRYRSTIRYEPVLELCHATLLPQKRRPSEKRWRRTTGGWRNKFGFHHK